MRDLLEIILEDNFAAVHRAKNNVHRESNGEILCKLL